MAFSVTQRSCLYFWRKRGPAQASVCGRKWAKNVGSVAKVTESWCIVLQRDARTYTLACLYFYVRRNLRWNTLVAAVQRLRSAWKSASANGHKKYKPSFMLVLVTAATSLIKDLPANDYEKETSITFVNYFIAMYQLMLKIMKFWEEMYLKHLSDLFATVPLWGRQLFIV